jgi:tRNA-intron endonuclease
MAKQKIIAYLKDNGVISNDVNAYSLYEKSRFGEKKNEKMLYMFSEAIYLIEKGKMSVFLRKKELGKEEFIDKIRKIDKKIMIRYPVFKDLREKGYIVKTALKFGTDFRIYEKGAKPKGKHSKWLVLVEKESKKITMQDFSSKSRVAHSTRKNLLLAVVDEEGDITYYEVKWIRP